MFKDKFPVFMEMVEEFFSWDNPLIVGCGVILASMIATLGVLGFGALVFMICWNSTMTIVFRQPEISYYQSYCIMAMILIVGIFHNWITAFRIYSSNTI